MILWHHYLTLLGSKTTLDRFDQNGAWEKTLGARHVEWLELSAKRRRCEFKTRGRVLLELQKLSRVWPRVVFLLDYEGEPERIKGLIKAQAGELESCEIRY
jgi:hypothetical protein